MDSALLKVMAIAWAAYICAELIFELVRRIEKVRNRFLHLPLALAGLIGMLVCAWALVAQCLAGVVWETWLMATDDTGIYHQIAEREMPSLAISAALGALGMYLRHLWKRRHRTS